MIHRNPEQQEDEVFLDNCAVPDSKVGWETQRTGNIAINPVTGGVVPGMFPIFIKRSELERAADFPINAERKAAWLLGAKLGRMPFYGRICLNSDNLEAITLMRR